MRASWVASSVAVQANAKKNVKWVVAICGGILIILVHYMTYFYHAKLLFTCFLNDLNLKYSSARKRHHLFRIFSDFILGAWIFSEQILSEPNPGSRYSEQNTRSAPKSSAPFCHCLNVCVWNVRECIQTWCMHTPDSNTNLRKIFRRRQCMNFKPEPQNISDCNNIWK